MSLVVHLLVVAALAADTGVAVDVSGSANPSAYAEALELAVRLEAERVGATAVEFHGGARGNPVTGVKADATATVTCGDGKHELSVSGVRTTMGSSVNNWQGVGKLVAERLFRDLACAPAPKQSEAPPSDEASPPDEAASEDDAPDTPERAEISPVERDDRVTGSTANDSFSMALSGAFTRALDGRPEITAVKFYGSSKGTPVVGLSANAGADVTCGGETHVVQVEDLSTPLGDGTSWSAFADMVVERLLRDLDCEE